VTDLVLYDDSAARAFYPFALTRPACELRAGALLLRERWERLTKARTIGFISSPHLADFDEAGAPNSITGTLKKGTIVVNARCAVALGKKTIASFDVLSCDERVAAVTLARDVDVAELASGKAVLESFARSAAKPAVVKGRWVDFVWDFITQLVPALGDDIPLLAAKAKRYTGGAKMVKGKHGVFAETGAIIEPQVYFDVTGGPVLIRRGATAQAFTRFIGPCVIGEESVAGADRIAVSSIGEHCKLHGEVNSVVMLGYSNKGHDGFVGHSYLGRWVNLGAGTITSNLKNTYGPVQFWTPDGQKETGAQFLGTFFGDHAKTGIGTRLTTGTVIGAGANIYGSAMPAKYVPPFSWGEHPSYSTYRMDKFLEVAKRVMARRHVELSARAIRQLTAAHALSTQKR
jgi:UDP-N-acetylglucosamine diphosphorylase/glucosamine-1-phosphate N-acetyltransferase